MLAYIVFDYLNYLTTLYAYLYSIWLFELSHYIIYMLAYIVFDYLNYLTTLYAYLYSIWLFELSHYLICSLI